MPVPEAQIEIPEIDAVDTPFKKVIAFSAALLVLIGSLLALAASRASEHEEDLSARAHKASISALADYGAAYVEISKLTGSDAEARSLLQRAELARVASSLTGSDAYTTAAQSWDKSAQALANLAVEETGAAHWDDVNLKATERLAGPRVTALQADAQRETATAWGAKADRYVLGITLLAVALSLLGLSLTLAEGIRNLAVVPAVVITVFAAGVSLAAAAQQPTVTPAEAVVALAEGDKQMTLGRFDAAIASYTKAIRLRGDYLQAYRARATAHLRAGSPENASYVITNVDGEHRDRSIEDLDRALDLKPVPDYVSLVNQGANLFHVRRYAESEELTRKALESNPNLPLPHANLGLVLAAQGKGDEARASYDDMIQRVADRPDPTERTELYASSRTALEILAVLEPHRKELVQELQGRLIAAQANQVAHGPNPAGADAQISALKLTASGWYVGATYQQANLPAQSRVSWIGYFRRSPDEPWQQRPDLVAIKRLGAADQGRQLLLDVGCPGRGEYRLDAWLDNRLLATTTATTTTSEAKPHTVLYDPSVRTWACRPAGWTIDDAVPGRIRLAAPDVGKATLTVRAAPLPAELIGRPVASVIRTALDTEPNCVGLGEPRAQSTYSVGAVAGVSRQFAKQKDGRAVWCWAGVGTDSSLRVVVAQYDGTTADAARINDLVSRLYFDVRPSPAQG